MSSDKEQTEARYYGLYHGVVTDNADPLTLGRVRVRVPGVVAVSAWATPFGWPGSGSAQRGTFDAPPNGADVIVGFIGGDPECPVWTGGNFGTPGGKTEVPTPIQGIAPGDAEKVKAYETKRWLITYDEREGKEQLQITDKVSGDKVEFDGHAMAITIKATTLLSLQSDGEVNITGRQIQIGGRPLLQNGKPLG